MPAALFGITDDGLNLAVNLIILFLVVVWIALIAWTFMDARRRLSDGVLVASATVAATIFPFVGSLVYSIVRPPEFLADKRERELEIRSAELRVRQLEESSCPNCSFPIERSYLRCPSCKARVKDPCDACGKPIDPRWALCPYCETAVRRSAPPTGKAPKRRAKASSAAPSGERRRKQPSEAARRVATGERKAAPARKSSERQQRPAKSRQAAAKRSSASEVKAPSKPTPSKAPGDGDERPATT